MKIAYGLQAVNKKVLALSEDPYNQLFDFTYVKFTDGMPLDTVGTSINRSVMRIVKDVKPDVLLIKLPKPLTRYNEKMVFDCGLSAYAISQALPADGAIICGLYELGSPRFWTEYLEGMQTRFGLSTFGVHLCNKIIDNNTSDSCGVIHFPLSKVSERVKFLNSHSDIRFYNLYEENDIDELIESIYSQFVDLDYGVIM